MPNKKRIYNRIRKIEIKQFKKGISNFIVASKQATFASDHMVDAFAYFITGIQRLQREVKVYQEFQYGTDFGSARMIPKKVIDNLPPKYLNDFIKLVDVGFSEEDAFETLKETFNF